MYGLQKLKVYGLFTEGRFGRNEHGVIKGQKPLKVTSLKVKVHGLFVWIIRSMK